MICRATSGCELVFARYEYCRPRSPERSAARSRTAVEDPMHEVAVSMATQTELQYGVAKRGHQPSLTTCACEFLVRAQVLPWTAEVGAVYGPRCSACEVSGIAERTRRMRLHANLLRSSISSLPDLDFAPPEVFGYTRRAADGIRCVLSRSPRKPSIVRPVGSLTSSFDSTMSTIS